MNVEEGKAYNLVMHIRSLESVELTASLTCSNGSQNLASNYVRETNLSTWTKIEVQLLAQGTCRNSRLELTTRKMGVIWLDQVSLMPSETYKGHGFRKELMDMLLDLKPRFLWFPGGCFVKGNLLKNAFRWKETIGPWEERPGHYGDVWHYWTDDGLGYYELLQLAEDLGAAPVWVLSIGMSHHDVVNGNMLAPFVKDAMDSLEFARGSDESTWGSVRATMGHPEPFPLKKLSQVQVAYPDIQIISNCDGSSGPLDHPADLYDYHIYKNASTVFLKNNEFDRTSRNGPKVFVSEYAVNIELDAGNGTLLASLAEAAFLTGVEKNSDVIQDGVLCTTLCE